MTTNTRQNLLLPLTRSSSRPARSRPARTADPTSTPTTTATTNFRRRVHTPVVYPSGRSSRGRMHCPGQPGTGTRSMARAQTGEHTGPVASYTVNKRGAAKARQLIDAHRYRVRSRWTDVQPGATEQNAFLETHHWDEYASWHRADPTCC